MDFDRDRRCRLRRRGQGRRSGDQRRWPRRPRRLDRGRLGASHPDYRPRQRRLGEGRAPRRAGRDQARGRRSRRPDPRLHRLDQGRAPRSGSGHLGLARRGPRLALPARAAGGRSDERPDRRAGGEPAGSPAPLRRHRQPRPGPGADRRFSRMIVTPKIFARLAAIAILAVLLQLSFFSRVEFLHTSADILPVAVFSLGFLVDCLLVAPLGGSSLVLLGAGYLAGLFRERFDIHSALVPPLICMALTLFAELGFAVMQVMLGIDAPVSILIVRDMALKSIYAFFLAWPIYFGLRRVLRPALVEEPKIMRRRQPTVLGRT